MSTDLFEIYRSIRDVQSRMSNVDHRLSKLAVCRGLTEAASAGQQLVRRAASNWPASPAILPSGA